MDTLFSVLIGGVSKNANVRRFNVLYQDAGRSARSLQVEDILMTLESELHLSVAMSARRKLFVHAGVVGWKGKAIVIPGRTMSGKTTLVAELVRAGATYYSDEYAVFDSDGRVHPYAKPLGLREPGEIAQEGRPVSFLGGVAGKTPLPVGLIAVTEFQPEARWRGREISAGQAALALMDNTVMARFRSSAALTTFQRALPGVLALRGRRGEARDAARRLLEYMEESTARSSLSGKTQTTNKHE